MSGGTVRDILGVRQNFKKLVPGGDAGGGKREAKNKRPEGMKREVYQLCGDGLPSLAQTVTSPHKDKSRLKHAVSAWTLAPFRNANRDDGLELCHWRKKDSPGEDSYSKKRAPLKVYTYTEQQWKDHIEKLDKNWTKAETDYLMHLCVLYELRFIVIADRFLSQAEVTPERLPVRKKTIEDIKKRYYSIARKLVEVEYDGRRDQLHRLPPAERAAAEKKLDAELRNHPIIKCRYDPSHDWERRMLLGKRFKADDKVKSDEKNLVDQIKALEKQIKTEENRQKQSQAADQKKKRKQQPEEEEDDTQIQVGPLPPWKRPGVYSASQALQAVQLPPKQENKVQTVLDDIGFKDFGVTKSSVALPRMATQQTVQAFSALRADAATMLNLARHLDQRKKEREMTVAQLQQMEAAVQQQQHMGAMGGAQGAPGVYPSGIPMAAGGPPPNVKKEKHKAKKERNEPPSVPSMGSAPGAIKTEKQHK